MMENQKIPYSLYLYRGLYYVNTVQTPTVYIVQ